jgi:hypothetical protein
VLPADDSVIKITPNKKQSHFMSDPFATSGIVPSSPELATYDLGDSF